MPLVEWLLKLNAEFYVVIVVVMTQIIYLIIIIMIDPYSVLIGVGIGFGIITTFKIINYFCCCC